MAEKKKPVLLERLTGAISRVAPSVAHALGGPLASTAVNELSKAIFGREDAGVAAVEAAVLAGDPETIRALREAELSFRRAVLEARLGQARIAADDRANARARQIALKDATPAALGFAVIAGFFFVLTVMLLRELPERAETEFSIMLGALATMTAAVVNYFFGSSADSREKTKLMSTQMR